MDLHYQSYSSVHSSILHGKNFNVGHYVNAFCMAKTLMLDIMLMLLNHICSYLPCLWALLTSGPTLKLFEGSFRQTLKDEPSPCLLLQAL